MNFLVSSLKKLVILFLQETDKKDESAQDADAKKGVDSDSGEEEQDNQQKEKGGLSNKKKKVFGFSLYFLRLFVLLYVVHFDETETKNTCFDIVDSCKGG